ncbi:MAG: Lrp/AsnC family transcriptional regulator [Candidatus Helarchaeota archaeon]
MFLDVIDIQILKLLQQNARLKLTDLAHNLNRTPATIKYRIDRLVKNGIIKKFTIQINYQKIGFEIHAYLILYSTKSGKQKLIRKLQEIKEVSKIVVLLGDPDLIVDISVFNLNELIEVLTKVSHLENVQKFKVWIVTDLIHLN